MSDETEAAYVRGHRQALVGIFRYCCRELGYDNAEALKVNWVVEREEAVAALRALCEKYGDNNWPNDLHLGDIIEKHLGRHLLLARG